MNSLTRRGSAGAKCISTCKTVNYVPNSRPTSWLVAALVLLITASAGCTYNHHLEIALRLDTLSEPAQMPLTVGIYYSPEFSTYKHFRLYGPHRYIIAVGKESTALFDKLAAMAFKNVVHLDGLPPFKGTSANVDAIIEPDITAFHFRVGFEGYSQEQGVGYRLNIFSKEGVPLESRIIFGQETPPQTHFYPWGHVGPDIQDAAGKILQEFHHLPDTFRAMKTIEATKPPFDVTSLTVSADAVDSPLPLTDELSIPLTEAGIIAVAVSVTNGSDRSMSINEANMRLVLSGGRTFASTGIVTIPSRLEQRSYAFEMGGVLGIVGHLGAAHLAAVAAREKRAALIDALKKKAFGERVLQKGESAEGIVFFVPAEGTPSFHQADLSIWFINAGIQSGIRINTAVTKLKFNSSPDKK